MENVEWSVGDFVLMEQFHSPLSELSPSGYIPTLSQLLQLAPEADKHNPLHAGKAQSILVTHYVDGWKLVQHNNDEGSRTEDSAQSDLDDMFPAENSLGRGIGIASGPGKEDIDTEGSVCSTMPWPNDHNEFLMDNSTSRHLCFEIASGSAVSHPAAWLNNNNNKERVRSVESRSIASVGSSGCSKGPVLLPGSLRERGEFSIIKVALVEQSTKREQRQFAWEVQNVDFYNIGSYR